MNPRGRVFLLASGAALAVLGVSLAHAQLNPAPGAAQQPYAAPVTPAPGAPQAPRLATPAPLPIPAPPVPTPTAPPVEKPAAPPKPVEPLKRTRAPIAILQALDKVTAETMRFEAPVGQPIRYKTLIFTVRACETSAADEIEPEAAAYVVVDSQPRPVAGRAPVPSRQVYRGWMYAGSPGVHPLGHPVYDAWLIACKAPAPPPAPKPKPKPAVAPPPVVAPSPPAVPVVPPAAPSPAAAPSATPSLPL